MPTSRRSYYRKSKELAATLHANIHNRDEYWGPYLEEITGNALQFWKQLSGLEMIDGFARFEVHSVRAAQRVGPDGDAINHAVVSITQKRRDAVRDGIPFRAGATLIFNLDTGRLQYAIAKGIDDTGRLKRQREFAGAVRDGSLRATYFGSIRDAFEPLAMLHRPSEEMP